MVRVADYNRPKNTRRALVQMLGYPGCHKWYMLIIALLVTVSTSVSILGVYLLKSMINGYITPGNISGLTRVLALMGLLYPYGVLTCLAYSQMVVHVSQQVVNETRADLFRRTQCLPLTHLDTHAHGELMSRLTNGVDTISEALSSSFAMMIQSFIIIIGTLTMLLILSWQPSLIVMILLALMFLFIRYNGKRSKKCFVQ